MLGYWRNVCFIDNWELGTRERILEKLAGEFSD